MPDPALPGVPPALVDGAPPEDDGLPLPGGELDGEPPEAPGMPPGGTLTDGPLEPPEVLTLELLQAASSSAAVMPAVPILARETCMGQMLLRMPVIIASMLDAAAAARFRPAPRFAAT